MVTPNKIPESICTQCLSFLNYVSFLFYLVSLRGPLFYEGMDVNSENPIQFRCRQSEDYTNAYMSTYTMLFLQHITYTTHSFACSIVSWIFLQFRYFSDIAVNFLFPFSYYFLSANKLAMQTIYLLCAVMILSFISTWRHYYQILHIPTKTSTWIFTFQKLTKNRCM